MKLAKTTAAVLCSAALASSMTLAAPAVSQMADTAGITSGWAEQSAAYAATVKLSKKSLAFKKDVATAATVTLKGVPNSAKGKVKWSAPKALSIKYPNKGDKRKAVISCNDFSGGKYTVTASYKGKKYKCSISVEKAAVETGVAKVMTAIENASGARTNDSGQKYIRDTSYSNGAEYTIGIVVNRSNGTLDFILLNEHGKVTSSVEIKCGDSNNATATSICLVSSFGITSTATINKATALKTSNYNWKTEDVSINDDELIETANSLADANTKLCLLKADVLLMNETGYTLADLGFTNL